MRCEGCEWVNGVGNGWFLFVCDVNFDDCDRGKEVVVWLLVVVEFGMNFVD